MVQKAATGLTSLGYMRSGTDEGLGQSVERMAKVGLLKAVVGEQRRDEASCCLWCSWLKNSESAVRAETAEVCQQWTAEMRPATACS